MSGRLGRGRREAMIEKSIYSSRGLGVRIFYAKILVINRIVNYSPPPFKRYDIQSKRLLRFAYFQNCLLLCGYEIWNINLFWNMLWLLRKSMLYTFCVINLWLFMNAQHPFAQLVCIDCIRHQHSVNESVFKQMSGIFVLVI